MSRREEALLEDPPEGRRLHILLVEDSPLQKMLVELFLKQLGHKVTLARDGFEALAAVQHDRCYDVILMDCKMPLMDGFEATRFIRKVERETNQQIGIIGISAEVSTEDCYKAGMDDFLRKPVNKMILKAVLGPWIRQKRVAVVS